MKPKILLTESYNLALAIVKRLREKGFEALFAGGYVRDLLLGVAAENDIDIATSATPQQIAQIFGNVIAVGEKFGVMIVVEHGVQFEVATFRSDIGIADGRHPAQVAFTSATEDAQRRDFTINGMFFDPLAQTVIDHVNGQQDIENGVIRAIGDPAHRFREDFLRMLRAVRFSTRLSFEIEPSTWSAIKDAAQNITKISPERIFSEIDKMITGPHPDRALAMLTDSGLCRQILPEVAAMQGVNQPPEFHPEGDVLVHTIKALSLLSNPTQVTAWSTLLHDIGKPPTMTITDRIRFNNHALVGAAMASTILRRLRAPGDLIDAVYASIDNHMNFTNVQQMRKSTLKKFLARATYHDELEMHRVDCMASHGDTSNVDFLTQKRSEFSETAIQPDPLLRGRDLIALGLKPGPIFGAILDAAYDLQLEDKLTCNDEAIAWARDHAGDYNK